jgi:hypothetical protein
VLGGERGAGGNEVGGRALEDDPVAVGAEADDPVGVGHDCLVVLDDDDRLAGVDEPVEQPECHESGTGEPLARAPIRALTSHSVVAGRLHQHQPVCVLSAGSTDAPGRSMPPGSGPRTLPTRRAPSYPEGVNTTVERRREERSAAVFEGGRRGTATADVDDFADVGEERPTSGSAPDDDPPIDLDAVRALVDMARSKRGTMSWFEPQRAYYRGVEVAAEQVLHPERASVRDVGWLVRHNPIFLSGYLETIAVLAPAWSWPSDRTEPTGRAA